MLAVIAAGAAGFLPQDAFAVAIATSTGRVDTANTMIGVNKPSAVCAGTQIGNFRTAFDGVTSCSNNSQVGGIGPFPILSLADTTAVGARIKRAFPQGYPGSNLQAGQDYLYNRRTNLGKVPLNTSASSTSPAGSEATASASQMPSANAANVWVGNATAQYKRVQFEPLTGMGIGIVNDPFDLSPLNPPDPGVVSVFLGNDGDLITLQADEPKDVAAATFALEVGDATLFAMTIEISFDTSSLDDAVFDISVFNATVLGYSDQSTFVGMFLKPSFSFDVATHTLSQLAPLLLNPNPILVSDTGAVVTYNYTAMAFSLPEPSPMLLFAAGAAVLAVAVGWQPPGRRQRG